MVTKLGYVDVLCPTPTGSIWEPNGSVATGEGGRAQKKLDPIVDPLQRRSVETRQRWQRVALRFEREVSVATLSVSFSVGVI